MFTFPVCLLRLTNYLLITGCILNNNINTALSSRQKKLRFSLDKNTYKFEQKRPSIQQRWLNINILDKKKKNLAKNNYSFKVKKLKKSEKINLHRKCKNVKIIMLMNWQKSHHVAFTNWTSQSTFFVNNSNTWQLWFQQQINHFTTVCLIWNL